MPAGIGVERLPHGIRVRREGVGEIHREPAGPGVLHAHLVPVEQPRRVEIGRPRVPRGLPHPPFEGRHRGIAPPARVGGVARAAARQLPRVVRVVLHIRPDRARIRHHHEPVVAVRVPRVPHHGPQIAERPPDLRHQAVDPRLPARLVLRLTGALECEPAHHTVRHHRPELEIVIGAGHQEHHLQPGVPGRDGETVALYQLVGVLLAAADHDVAAGRTRAGGVVRHIRRDTGPVDRRVRRPVAPVVRTVRARLIRPDALPRDLAVPQRDQRGLPLPEGPLGRIPVELRRLPRPDLLQPGRQRLGGHGPGRRPAPRGSGGGTRPTRRHGEHHGQRHGRRHHAAPEPPPPPGPRPASRTRCCSRTPPCVRTRPCSRTPPT